MDRDTKETCISDSVTGCDLKKMPEMLACCTDKGCEVRNLAVYMGMRWPLPSWVLKGITVLPVRSWVSIKV